MNIGDLVTIESNYNQVSGHLGIIIDRTWNNDGSSIFLVSDCDDDMKNYHCLSYELTIVAINKCEIK